MNALHCFHICKVPSPFFQVSTRGARWIKPYPDGPRGMYKRLRGQKILKINLPNFEDMRRDEKLSPEEIRTKLKERGIAPPRNWTERTLALRSSSAIFEQYLPPEGDGKRSLIKEPIQVLF